MLMIHEVVRALLQAGILTGAAASSSQELVPASLFWGDADGDGLLDAVAIDASGAAHLLRNQGDGRLTDVTDWSGLEGVSAARLALWQDYDLDGQLDLFVGTRAGAGMLFHNIGEGRFEDVAARAGIVHTGDDLSAAWLDYDQDGLPDLHVRTAQGDVLYRNLGNGSFDSVDIQVPSIQVRMGSGQLESADAPSGATTPGSDTAPSSDRASDRPAADGPGLGLPTDRSNSTVLIGPGTSTAAGPAISFPTCVESINDQAASGCITASSVPTIGSLYPMTDEFYINGAGSVVIANEAELDLYAPDAGGAVPMLHFRDPSTGADWVLNHDGNSFHIQKETAAGSEMLTIQGNGNVGIGTTTPTKKLDVDGDIRSKTIELTGADLVEAFDTGDAFCEPGTVVVIDEDNPGQLKAAGTPYDTRVAGVVSGAGGVEHGIYMGRDSSLDGSTPVAMTGRVYVKTTAENGPIRPGDRLTTASVAGHAMRVTDNARSVGTVIGKAMTSLESGTGLVLVLVNLQ